MKSILYLCILFHLVVSEEAEWAFPIIRVTNSTTQIIDNMEGKIQHYKSGESIVPPYLFDVLFKTEKYNGKNNVYMEAVRNQLCDFSNRNDQADCRYVPIHPFGFFCPCCSSAWGDYNVIPPPPFLNEKLTEIYYKAIPNSMYVLRDNLYLGYRKFNTNSTYEEMYYHRSTDKPIFVTGNKCSLNDREGISVLIPYKAIDVSDVSKIQNVINYMTL